MFGVAAVISNCALGAFACDLPENASISRGEARDRVIRKEVIVPASVDAVWAAWTTTPGMARFFAPDAKIELRIGGAYELYIVPSAPEGQRGAEGCRVLSFIPNEMLSFEWNFPPSIPALREAGEKTYVVLRFDRLSADRTRVRLEQRGWKEGADWDKGIQYFDRAWSHVLQTLAEKLAPDGSPAEESAQQNPAEIATDRMRPFAPLIGTWTAEIKSSGGASTRVRVEYKWGLGERVIHARSFFLANDAESQRYETLIGWDPEIGKTAFRSYGMGDTVFDGWAIPVEGGLDFEWVAHAPGGSRRFRQCIRFSGPDSYEWTVFEPAGDGWTQIMAAVYRRAPSP